MARLRSTFIFGLLSFFASAAAAVSSLTYQGRIVHPDGTPVEAANVTITVQIQSAGAEDCLLYQESHTLNMTNTNGVFSLSIGTGTRPSASVDGGFTLSRIFSNSPTAITPLPTCASGNSYTPSSSDTRLLKISFNDGSGVQTLQTQSMNAVPFAVETSQIGGYDASHLLRVNGATAPAFSAAELTELQSLIAGTSSSFLNSGSALNGANVTTGTISDASLASGISGAKISGNISGNSAGFTGSLAGDVSGTQGATSVDKIKGVAVSATAPAAGQVLRHNGTQWVATTPNFADLKNSSGVAQFPTTCDSTQTLTYDSVNDKFICTTVSVSAFSGSLSGDVTGPQAGTVVTAVGGVTAANVGAGANLANAATNANTASTIVRRDASGNFTAGNITATTFTGSLSGVAYDTTHIQNQPVDATAPTGAGQSLRWDGAKYVQTNLKFQDLKNASGVAQIPTTCDSTQTLTYDSVNDKFVCTAVTVSAFSGSLSGDVTGPQATTVVATVGGVTAANVASGANLANAATNANTASTIVKRDASGNFTAGTITANLTGNVTGTATNTTQVQGQPIDATAPTGAGQSLRWDGAKYVQTNLKFQDLKNATGVAQFPTTCDSTQTLTYDSVNDKFVCTAVTVSAFSGSLAGDVTGPQGTTVVATVGGVTAANVAAGATLANAATNANTASTIVKRDASGNFTAGTVTATSFVGALTGTATNTTQVQGQPVDATAPTGAGQSLRWDGAKYVQTNLKFQDLKNASGVAQIPTTCDATQTLVYDSGTDKFLCTSVTVSAFSGSLAGDVTGPQATTVVANVGGVTAANVASGANLANAATNANTASTIVKRDASGNFTAGTITANLTGNVTGTATNTTKIQGQSVDVTAPTAAGQLLRWDGTKYAVANLKFQDLKTGAALAQFPTNCSTTQVMIYSAITDAYECQNIMLANTTSTMTGDVTGSITTNTVVKIQGRDVSATAPTNGQVLKWNNGATRWEPTAELWAANGSDISFATGKVGIGTTTPSNSLDVNGAIRSRIYDNSAGRTIDWSLGNVQYTTAGCDGTNFTMNNMLDGASYTLILKAASHTGLCAFTGSSVSNWRFRPSAYQPSGYVVLTFLKAGSDVFIAWSDNY